MTTMLRHKKTTTLGTLIAFVATAGFAEPTLASSAAFAAPAGPAPAVQQSRSAPPSAPLQINHDPLACMTTAAAPIVEAKVLPAPDIARSYAYWRASGTPYFYYTVLEGAVPDVRGVIPRPLPETKSVDYYLLATNKASLNKKTPDYAPPVVDRAVCKERGLPVGAGGAGLTIGLTDEKQGVVPPGFNRNDIAKVFLLTGVVVSLATALSMPAGGAAGMGASSAPGAGTSTATAGTGTGRARAGDWDEHGDEHGGGNGHGERWRRDYECRSGWRRWHQQHGPDHRRCRRRGGVASESVSARATRTLRRRVCRLRLPRGRRPRW